MSDEETHERNHSFTMDDIELRLLHESVSTMRMTAVQRLEMAGMAGKFQKAETMAFLHDKVKRLSELEDRVLSILNPNAARLRGEESE